MSNLELRCFGERARKLSDPDELRCNKAARRRTWRGEVGWRRRHPKKRRGMKTFRTV